MLLGDFDTVIIDAGHGGSDPGATVANVQEKDNTMLDAFTLADILNKRGCPAKLTRDRDVFHSPAEKARIANTLGTPKSLLISLHNNKYLTTSANGFEIFVHPNAGSDLRRIARDMAVETVKAFPSLGPLRTESGGIPGVKTARFTVLANTEMPALLIESGFLSNKEERDIVSDDTLRKKRMEVIADVICQGQTFGAEIIVDEEKESEQVKQSYSLILNALEAIEWQIKKIKEYLS